MPGHDRSADRMAVDELRSSRSSDVGYGPSPRDPMLAVDRGPQESPTV